jgi:hypothetical protein
MADQTQATVYAGWLEGRTPLHQHDRAEIAAELRRLDVMTAGLVRANGNLTAKNGELHAEVERLRAALPEARDLLGRHNALAANCATLRGEARVLRALLRQAADVLDTITDNDSEDGGAALRALRVQIAAALDPSSRDNQQMAMVEASRTGAASS